MDCVLLCGTATALLLNTITDPGQAWHAFHKILQSILHSGRYTPLDSFKFNISFMNIHAKLHPL